MRLQLYNICPELEPYVKLICTMECDEDSDTGHIRVLPDTCVELFINYTTTPVAIIGNQLYKGSIITSRMSRAMDVQMRKGSGCLAICFYPGRAYKFFHNPMQELSDRILPLEEMWQVASVEIEEQIAGAGSNHQRVSIIQQFLIRLLGNSEDDKYVAQCLNYIHANPSSLTVADLTRYTGFSQRHLSRRFQQCVGLSPKEYLKVSRFLKSLKYLRQYPGSLLTDLSYKSGYYDQAHFIRDYKTFTGHTPGKVATSPDILY